MRFRRYKRLILNKKGMTGKEAVALLIFFFIFGIVFSVLEVIKQIWPVLLVALVGLIIFAVASSRQAETDRIAREKAAEEERQRKEAERKEEEKRQDLKWLSLPEPSLSSSRKMPAICDYPKEEGRVGKEYIEYLKEKDNIDRLEQHIKWIDKYNSICHKHSVPDKKDYSEDRSKSLSELSLSKQKISSMKYKPLFQPDYRVSSLTNAYEKLQSALQKAQRNQYDYSQDAYGFFGRSEAMEQDTYLNKGSYYITPWYVLCIISKFHSSFNLYQYQDTSAEIWCDEEIVRYASYNDDVARIEWEHAKKDGGPDLRYSDNESTTYVYRGRVKIRFGTDDNEVTLKFSNKRNAQDFCVAWKEYTNLTKKRENAAIINAVLNNSSKSLDEYFNKKERNKANREKRKQKKKDYVNGLGPGSIMTHKTLGKGKLVSIDVGYMIVEFNGEQKKFKYPDAIKNGFFNIN